MPETARYRFGPFVLDPPLRRLLRDSHEVALPPKAFDILVRLVRARDRVLTKLDLLDEIWKHTAVTENTLTHASARSATCWATALGARNTCGRKR